jgi:hypothetical protein
MKRIFMPFTFFIIVSAHAQFFIPPKTLVKEAAHREILVLLENPAQHRNQWLNSHTQQFTKQLWKFTPALLYRNHNETENLLKNNPDKYATLSWYYTERTYPGSHVMASREVFVLGLRLYGKDGDYTTVGEVAFPDDNITEYDIAFAIQHLQIDLEAGLYDLRKDDPAYWNDSRLAEIMKGQTVFTDNIKGNPEIPEKIEIEKANSQAITRAVINRQEKRLFITTIFSDKYFMPIKAIISTETMEPVLYLKPKSTTTAFVK